jgi:hypothetical protein
MDLLTPEDQSNVHYWASVLLAHSFLGFMISAIVSSFMVALTEKHYALRVSLTMSALYLILWEGMIQRMGAGFGDAYIDTFAFLSGALTWTFAATRKYYALLFVAAILGGVIAARLGKDDEKDKRD